MTPASIPDKLEMEIKPPKGYQTYIYLFYDHLHCATNHASWRAVLGRAPRLSLARALTHAHELKHTFACTITVAWSLWGPRTQAKPSPTFDYVRDYA